MADDRYPDFGATISLLNKCGRVKKLPPKQPLPNVLRRLNQINFVLRRIDELVP
jgi:hypothetical protein